MRPRLELEIAQSVPSFFSSIFVLGKIQGDGRKFLDRFKSYFGSQISQSLNEIHIYRLQPKSATKGELYIFLSLIVSSRRHGLQMANEADEVLLGKRPR